MSRSELAAREEELAALRSEKEGLDGRHAELRWGRFRAGQGCRQVCSTMQRLRLRPPNAWGSASSAAFPGRPRADCLCGYS